MYHTNSVLSKFVIENQIKTALEDFQFIQSEMKLRKCIRVSVVKEISY